MDHLKEAPDYLQDDHLSRGTKAYLKVLNGGAPVESLPVGEWDSVEIVIDEDVKTDEDTRKLGIETGDIVCFEPVSYTHLDVYKRQR